jgi:hypothetical protein
VKWLSCLGLYFFSRQGGKRVTVGDASNRSIEKGTLEQIIVIDASFPPSLYIYLSIYLSLSLPARDIPVATFLASKFYLQWYL